MSSHTCCYQQRWTMLECHCASSLDMNLPGGEMNLRWVCVQVGLKEVVKGIHCTRWTRRRKHGETCVERIETKLCWHFGRLHCEVWLGKHSSNYSTTAIYSGRGAISSHNSTSYTHMPWHAVKSSRQQDSNYFQFGKTFSIEIRKHEDRSQLRFQAPPSWSSSI